MTQLKVYLPEEKRSQVEAYLEKMGLNFEEVLDEVEVEEHFFHLAQQRQKEMEKNPDSGVSLDQAASRWREQLGK